MRTPEPPRDADGPTPAEADLIPRLFVREPGWRVVQKVGSMKEHCYMTAPGQDYYHRLLDGEVYLQRGDEKLCLRCADRRGLLTFEPKRLGQAIYIELPGADPGPPAYDFGPPRG
jgi:hypothetical protein